ncbi:four helix bundle protein [Spongiivirga sp. MCCC 1A20706]|uniref:four helix bundle protein n=1 Tax=Spongiivirga sp. MCCC 1A20706 TaxID=3160963 RepID=UPI003977AACC
MATIRKFEDLEIWQEARRISKIIISISQTTELKTDFKLRDQIKGSIGSVMDNIAEGFDRDGNKEFRQFLSMAKGSAGETRSQCYRVFDSGYIQEEQLNEFVKDLETLSKRISAFISYLNKEEFKGLKFKG